MTAANSNDPSTRNHIIGYEHLVMVGDAFGSQSFDMHSHLDYLFELHRREVLAFTTHTREGEGRVVVPYFVKIGGEDRRAYVSKQGMLRLFHVQKER
jgi:hypothetical protein